MKKTGSQIIVECLKKEGVDIIFNYPGGAVLPLFDELQNASFRQVLDRHEQAAVHAADGYARATGKVGVVLVTSGPAATNTVTGIATAFMDSIPVVIMTGQVPTLLIGNDAFQEADIVGITRPCTKHNYLVKDLASGATMSVRPSTSNEVTDASLALKNVTVKSHLYTFTGARVVTFATLTGVGNLDTRTVSGKVISTTGTAVAEAIVYFSDSPNAAANPIVTATTDASGSRQPTVLIPDPTTPR